MKITVPICNRTNYSKLKPVLKLLEEMGGSLRIILSSGIVVPRHGDAKRDVCRNFEINHEVDCLLSNDTTQSMCKSIGLSIIEHSSIFHNNETDALLVIGDRFDILPSVIAAKVMNIPIFHIQGGEKSGSIDDTIRNMISVCSSRHYVATEKSKEIVAEITQSGHIYNFGCPSVESTHNIPITDGLDSDRFIKSFPHFDIDPHEEYFLVVVHPNTLNEQDVLMDNIVESVLSFSLKCIIVYPNVDAYSSKIVDIIRKYKNRCICVKHFAFDDFVQVMAHAKCMIGNSSAGIREAASFGVPVVNIGNRQANRERNPNIIDCPSDEKSISASITQALKLRLSNLNIYYQPNSANRIAENILEASNEGI